MGKYAKTKWIEILREGTWNGLEYTPRFIDDIAESYDPELLKAPLTLGHPNIFDTEEKPAIGHVLELKADEGTGDKDHYRLMGNVGFSKEAVEMVESGKFAERSIGWDAFYPMMGIPYLVHLALLGAKNPAAVGMDEIELSFNPLQIIDNDEFDSLEDTSGNLSRPVNLIWDITDEKIRYRVRPMSRFRDDTMITKWFSKKEGINAVMGKLKEKYVPKGADTDGLVIQNIMFDKAKDWDLKKAKAWVKEYKGTLSKSENEVDDSDEESIQNKIVDENKKKDGDTPMSKTDVDEVVEEKVEPKQKTDLPPETPPKPERILIEPKSTEDLQVRNKELQVQVDEANAALFAMSEKLNSELSAEVSELHASRISTKLQFMQVEGYITNAQLNMGLTAALSAIPAELRIVSPVSGKKVLVTDVIAECLKVGGKLKLKGEFDIPVIEEVEFPDLEIANKSGKVQGIDVAAKMTRLMEEEGKSPAEAIAMAEREMRGAK